jgi:hypothetical protein
MGCVLLEKGFLITRGDYNLAIIWGQDLLKGFFIFQVDLIIYFMGLFFDKGRRFLLKY